MTHSWPEAGPFCLDGERAYAAWREAKLAHYPASAEELSVAVRDLADLSAEEVQAIRGLCQRPNMAIYTSGLGGTAARAVRPALHKLASGLALRAFEDHRSMEADGIVAIEVSGDSGKSGYIPYTDRPIAWHTDGYYNYHGPARCIQAMVLHCVRDAPEGGENRLLDPEIAYIRLRDKSPAFIEALMHPSALTIPAGEEAGGRPRPHNTGPVFLVEPARAPLLCASPRVSGTPTGWKAPRCGKLSRRSKRYSPPIL